MSKMLFFKFTAILLIAFTFSFAQNKATNELVENLVRIDSNRQIGYSMSMDLFQNAISNTKILSLGEATHGTKNFVD